MEVVKRWRADWRYPTSLLCIYGFFSSIKPLEPFIVAYMTGPDVNLTMEEVNNQIFPVSTYSYLCALVPVFMLTDWLYYKPVVVLQGVALFTTIALLRWTRSVTAMQATQFSYGVVMASEVAYFSYIYSVVESEKYRKATSYIRSVQLLGYTMGAVLGQLLVSFELLSFHGILVFTLVLISIALLTSCLLPMPRHSMFFHREHTGRGTNGPKDGRINGAATSAARPSGEGEPPTEGQQGNIATNKWRVLLWLRKEFLHCYSSKRLLSWSLWWAMATCGYNQVLNYIQVLWEHVEPSQNFSSYNGGVEAVSSLLSAATAYGIGFAEVSWEQWGELALGGFSGLAATALFLMTFLNSIWVCYIGYVVFKCLYMLLITIATYQIATDLSMERYARVFGGNNFGALVLQTTMTSIVVDSSGLGLSIISQFTIYASYFACISIIFSVRGLFAIWKVCKRNTESTPPFTNECSEAKECRL